MRVKVLAKEIVKGIKALDALHTRAYELHIAENPLPAWANDPGSDALDMDEPTLDAESFKEFPELGIAEGVHEAQTYDTDEEDLIDLKLRRQVHQFGGFHQDINFDVMIRFCQRESQHTPLLRTLPRHQLYGFHTAQRTRSHRLREARQSWRVEKQSEGIADDSSAVYSANHLPPPYIIHESPG